MTPVLEMYSISKTTYLYGSQCIKRLFLHKYHERLRIAANPIDSQSLALLESGKVVGKEAQKYFPGGIDCSVQAGSDLKRHILLTRKLCTEQSPVLYEAAFEANGVLAIADIMTQSDNKYHVYEVKATTSVKDIHIEDAAVQLWVLRKNNINVESINIMNLNTSYIKKDNIIDIHQLFEATNVTKHAEMLQSRIQDELQLQLDTLTLKDENNLVIPKMPVGPHCTKPYSCNFTNYCNSNANIPEYSVLNISNARGKQWDLIRLGITKIEDIPMDELLTDTNKDKCSANNIPATGTEDVNQPLNDSIRIPTFTESQRIQILCEKTKQPYIDRRQLKEFLNKLKYPLYYIDFESMVSPIPIYNNSHSYQQICFQYSMHIQPNPISGDNLEDDGKLIAHREFLGSGSLEEDPREPFLQSLISNIGEHGSILVYNQAYEKTRLLELSQLFPKYRPGIKAIIDRLVDLAIPFQRKYYYNPAMKGSYSIKKVLPALITDLSYSHLTIKDGHTASNVYISMVNNAFDGDVMTARKDLLRYCRLDTWAMVRLLNKLFEISSVK